MDLLGVRTQFAKLSGRYDLVVPSTYADAGANFYINEGMRFLERLIGFPKDSVVGSTALTAGGYQVKLTRCRAVLQAWRVDTNGTRTQLVKRDRTEMLEKYGKSYATVTTGTPVDYAIALPGELTSFGNDALGLVVMPPTNASVNIETVGVFYTADLALDADTNYWTLMHPFLLVKAALYQLECGYRNTEGQADWLAAIQVEVAGIDKDQVQEDVSEVSMLRG